MEKKEYYQDLLKYLKSQSEEICVDNGCTEEDHQCNSCAYFDYIKESDIFLHRITCYPDYCQRSYDICLPMPINAKNGKELLELLKDEKGL